MDRVYSGTATHAFVERLALDVLHRDERSPVRLADFVDRADVRVIESGRAARLSHETPRGDWIRRRAGRQELQRDAPAQLRVVREIDFAHPAGAEFGADDVAAEYRAGRQ